MIKKMPSRLFFILVSIAMRFITFLKHPALSRQKMFFEFENSLKVSQFDPEEYWEFRERFSPGSFIRDDNNIDFFANFRITSVENGLTPLFYYESKNLRSLDALVLAAPSNVINNF